MKMTNEEFRAEIFRRKSEILRARKTRNKRIFAAILCMPLCFVLVFAGVSLSIGMQGAGSAAPNNSFGNGDFFSAGGTSLEETVITEGDSRLEIFCLILDEVISREPETTAFDWDLKKSFKYKVTLATEEKIYYINEQYLFDGENTFSITDVEYAEICDILS